VSRHRPVVLLLLAFALLLAPAIARAGTCTPDASWGRLDTAIGQEVAVQLNQQRAANGLAPLALSPTLTAAAQWKSLHMAYYGYFDHSDPAPPVARTAGQRMSDCGYPSAYNGEDIAEGFDTASSVMTAWMNSPGHRANILGPFVVMGIGAGIDARGQYYWTVDFGGVADAGTVPVGTQPATPVPTTPTTTAPPLAAPPVTTAPVTTPPVTTTAPPATTPIPTPVKATTPTKSIATATPPPAAPAADAAVGTPSAAKTAIGTPVAKGSRLVALPDTFHARPGRPRILRPLGNDQNPSAKPMRIVAILEKPKGSSAKVVRGGHAIRLRLPNGAHGATQLVYVVTTAAGELARGVITIITRKLT
jgi:uncharacterized protein YkwD